MHNFRLLSLIFSLLVTASNLIAQSVIPQDNYDVKSYFLDIKIDNISTNIAGANDILVQVLTPSDSVVFDMGNQLMVSNVEVNGVAVNYKHEFERLSVFTSFLVDSLYVIRVEYSGNGDEKENEGALYNKSYLYYGSFTYSLTEPYSSKYWYPCKQVLTDKADSIFVYVTIPKGLKVGSNGILKNVVELNEELVQFQWESHYPTAFYLISVAVGEYIDYTFEAKVTGIEAPIPVVNYLYNSTEYIEAQKKDIDTTSHLLELFSELFIPYPFAAEKYGHCIVPLGGGMEHQTMTTLGSFNFGLVAHELAHQWFGNYVTCETWNDIWINEGFASYSEYLAYEFSGDLDAALSFMDYAQSLARASELSIYVPDDELESSSRIFDYKSTYKKGAAIIHMLRYEIDNDELFFQVLKDFLTKNAFGNAGVDDLQNILFEVCGERFDQFFDQWYYGKGYPVFKINWHQKNDVLSLSIEQLTTQPESTPFFETSLDLRLIYPTGDTLVKVQIEDNFDHYEVTIDKPVYSINVDPNNILLKAVSSVTRVDSLMANRPEILLFPNPTKNLVNVYLPGNFKPVELIITNLSGKVVKQVNHLIPSGGEVSLFGMDKGIYFVEVRMGEKTGIVKLIKT